MGNKGIPLVVLSAGMGRRFGGLKQIKPVGPGGEVILDYSLFDAIKVGFSRVVFVIRKNMEEDFKRAVGDFWEKKIDVKYAFQEIDSFLPKNFSYPKRNKPWGTAHALLVSKNILNSPFAVINADDYYGFESLNLVFKFLLEGKNEHVLISYKLRDTLSPHGYVSRAICEIDENSYLLNLNEIQKIEQKGNKIKALKGTDTLELQGDERVSMNLFGFLPSIFDFLEVGFKHFLEEKGKDPESEFLLPDLIGNLVKKNQIRVKVIPTSSNWFGVTYPEDLEIVKGKIEELIKDGKYPEKIRG